MKIMTTCNFCGISGTPGKNCLRCGAVIPKKEFEEKIRNKMLEDLYRKCVEALENINLADGDQIEFTYEYKVDVD
jgi:hypothetical protein